MSNGNSIMHYSTVPGKSKSSTTFSKKEDKGLTVGSLDSSVTGRSILYIRGIKLTYKRGAIFYFLFSN